MDYDRLDGASYSPTVWVKPSHEDDVFKVITLAGQEACVNAIELEGMATQDSVAIAAGDMSPFDNYVPLTNESTNTRTVSRVSGFVAWVAIKSQRGVTHAALASFSEG